MVSLLITGSTPLLYRFVICKRRGVTYGRVREIDLDAMTALRAIGRQTQDWDDDRFLKAAERWGAKNVMRKYGPHPYARRYGKVPINALVEGRDSKRYDAGSLWGDDTVLQRVILDEIEVIVPDHLAHLAHTIHPNCTINVNSLD